MAQLNNLYTSPQSTPEYGAFILKVLRTFQWVVRYIDDLLIMAPPFSPRAFIEHFLYTNRTYHGVVGIYPPSVRLVATSPAHGLSVNYMDITTYLQHGSHGPVMTKLYDKRAQPELLSRLQPIRLQHMSTCLSEQCKWNIFDGQFVRCARIISDRDNFINEVVQRCTTEQDGASTS